MAGPAGEATHGRDEDGRRGVNARQAASERARGGVVDKRGGGHDRGGALVLCADRTAVKHQRLAVERRRALSLAERAVYER